jgi:hypothetical protein
MIGYNFLLFFLLIIVLLLSFSLQHHQLWVIKSNAILLWRWIPIGERGKKKKKGYWQKKKKKKNRGAFGTCIILLGREWQICLVVGRSCTLHLKKLSWESYIANKIILLFWKNFKFHNTPYWKGIILFYYYYIVVANQ